MAGLDAEDSPFNHSTRDHLPKFQKQSSRSNGFHGDISSNNQKNNSFGVLNGNIRPKPYLGTSTDDPTMKNSYIDDSHDEAQRKRDELYERILQETSNAFRNMGDHDLTVDVTGDTTQDQDETADDEALAEQRRNMENTEKHMSDKFKSKIPRPDHQKDSNRDTSLLSDKYESIRGPEGEIIMSLSPMDDGDKDDSHHENARGDMPDRGRTSRISDFSYGMDSFEQSYVSEKGEVVHLGDDVDFYPESPSPIHQDSDKDDF